MRHRGRKQTSTETETAGRALKAMSCIAPSSQGAMEIPQPGVHTRKMLEFTALGLNFTRHRWQSTRSGKGHYELCCCQVNMVPNVLLGTAYVVDRFLYSAFQTHCAYVSR